MFTDWMQKNELSDFLLPVHQFHPYPTIEERELWESIRDERRAFGIAEAEKYLNYSWPSITAVDFMQYARTGNRTIYETPHFARRRAMETLVLGECLENKGRFVDDIINGIWCLCEESFWGVPAHNGVFHSSILLPDVENIYIDLFAAETGGLLAWILYLMRDLLDEITPLLSRRIDMELEKRIKEPFLNRYDFGWMGYQSKPVNNWNPWILSNVVSVFLIEETNEKRRVYAVKKMLECAEAFISGYHSDGGCDEGTSYWNVAGGALFDFIDQLYLACDGKLSFYEEPLIQEIGRFIYRSHITDSYFINFADGSASPTLALDMVYRYGKRIADEKLMNLAAYLAFSSDASTESVGFDKKREPNPLRRALPGIFVYDEMKKRQAKPPYEGDVWMDGIQVFAAREKAGTDTGLYLAAKGGHNAESHNHNDIGSFIVYLNGKPALIDVGVETYTKKTFSAERYTIWTMQSSHHNLPTINGCDQLPGEACCAKDLAYQQSADGTTCAMRLEAAYSPEADLQEYRRSFQLNRGENPEIVLADHFVFKGQRRSVIMNFMSWQKPEMIDDSHLKITIEEGEEVLLTIPASSNDAISFEHYATNDERLYPIWGDAGIWRTGISYSVPDQGDLLFRISQI